MAPRSEKAKRDRKLAAATLRALGVRSVSEALAKYPPRLDSGPLLTFAVAEAPASEIAALRREALDLASRDAIGRDGLLGRASGYLLFLVDGHTEEAIKLRRFALERAVAVNGEGRLIGGDDVVRRARLFLGFIEDGKVS